MRCDGEKVIARADRFAQFSNQLLGRIRSRLVRVDRLFIGPRF
jgi:hypothetical protein